MSLDKINKKMKLSLDEMYENESVGNMGSRKDGHPANQPDVHSTNSKNGQTSSQPTKHSTERLTCKITFNTSERLMDAFNEIYARRIMEKRKTDKSALLNEALELLIEKEKNK